VIGLYWKEGIEWVNWEHEDNYLVTRRDLIYYDGEIPNGVKDDYLDRGVGIVRAFIQKLRDGDFYFAVKKRGKAHPQYDYFLWLGGLGDGYPFLSCNKPIELSFMDADLFQYMAEHAIGYDIGKGEVIAGTLLDNGIIRLVSTAMRPVVKIDIGDTPLPIMFFNVKQLMTETTEIESVIWANMDIIAVNGEPVRRRL